MRKGHGKSVVGKCSFLQCQYDLENRHKLILRTRAWNWLPNIRNLILWMTGTMRKLFMCYIKKNNNWGRAFFLNSKKNWSIVMISKSIWASKYFAFLSSFYDLHCHKTKPWDYISIKTKQNKTRKKGISQKLGSSEDSFAYIGIQKSWTTLGIKDHIGEFTFRKLLYCWIYPLKLELGDELINS